MGGAMAKFLLILCLVFLTSVEGQPCTQLPSQSSISSELAAEAGLPSVDIIEIFHNCIVYGEATGSRTFTKTTVTGRFTPGSPRIGQIIFMCDGGVWIPIEAAVGTAGLTQNVVGGCSDCSPGTTLAQTCTACGTCQNGGTVNLDCSCTCREGYTGVNCESDIDECDRGLDDCSNGGICSNTMGGFTCECPLVCSGTCNACCSSPCLKGGTCISNIANSFTCMCPPAFTGPTCEFLGGLCISNPCQNNGFCRNIGDGSEEYECVCATGYTGTNCETEIDNCASNPCLHSGYCTSYPTGYTCECLQGFTGPDCGAPMLTCEIDGAQCGPQGTCTTRVVGPTTSRVCSCNAGYTGDNCMELVSASDCNTINDPCYHSSTCTPAAAGATIPITCNCTDNWEGFYCTECQPLECQNGGTFDPQCTGCNCTTRWTGPTCNVCDHVIEDGRCIPECTREGYVPAANNTCYASGINYCFISDENNRCITCYEDYRLWNFMCITIEEFLIVTKKTDNTGETIGIILGCIAGAVIVLVIVFALTFVALQYIRKSGEAAMVKEVPQSNYKQQTVLSGFTKRASTHFSSGGHTGGIPTGNRNSFPTYQEMVNEVEDTETSQNQNDAYENVEVTPQQQTSGGGDDDEDWLPPPND